MIGPSKIYDLRRERPIPRPLLKTPQFLVLTVRADGTADYTVVMAAFALRIASRLLPPYSSPFSPRKFTQPQLAVCIAMKTQLGMTYRGVARTLEQSPKLCRILSLKTVPDHSTLKRFEDRTTTPGMLLDIWKQAFKRTRRFAQWSSRHSYGRPLPSPNQTGISSLTS